MPDDYNPTPGSYMDRVDKAGGIEEYKLAQVKEFMASVSKVKPEQWSRLNDTLKTVKSFLDVDTNAFTTLKTSIVDSIELKTAELLSDARNEFNELINKILEPLLPFLSDIVNGIIVPTIQWIADRVQDIIDFFSKFGGSPATKSYVEWLWENRSVTVGMSQSELLALYLASIPTNTSGYGR